MTLLVRVAEAGSMTLAAKQLHLTPAAVSAAIQRIEGVLDVRIFERTTRSLHPTDEGLAIIDGCRDVVGRWARVLEEARAQRAEVVGVVHLAAPADTTYEILESVVTALCTEHPKLRVVLKTGDVVQQLHREAIDMAIRYGPLRDSTLSVRKLAELPEILVASPSYLAERGVPETPQSLARHRCLTLHRANAPPVAWQLHRDGTVQAVAVESPLCGDGYLARRWALAGMGIARKSLFDVIDDLEAGRLVRVLPEYTCGDSGIYAVFPSRRFLPTRVRAVDAAITRRFSTRAARCRAWLAAACVTGAP
ncbi:MAG: LysR family transcriptional regulator [Deltaproteobacteria bacterium]|nr:MAG: LysR family transcriptional regulator [Deltaproteobacteria bacterium]